MRTFRGQSNVADLRAGFTLIEVLVVIGIIAFLIALTLPVLESVRRSARTVQCGSNLKQIHAALEMYLGEHQNMTFWRGENIDTDGMEWYVYGGRETGNTCIQQDGIFNNTVPRPLNKYVGNNVELFRCPEDVPGASPWTEPEETDYWHYNWTGNSYNFNANGDPELDYNGGLSGVRFTRIKDSANTVLFTEAAHVWGYAAMGETAAWHPQAKANVCFADGHVEFIERPRSRPNGQYLWGVDPETTGP